MNELQQVPLLPGRPVVGHLLAVRRDPLGFFLRASLEGGNLVRFRVGPFERVMVNAAEYVGLVLVEHADDFEKTPNFRRFAGPIVGNGLLTSENVFHKRQRKLVAPAFQHRNVAAYADTMAEYTERFQRGWADGATIDVAHELMRLTLWIVGKTLFGAEVLEEAEAWGEALTTAMRHVTPEFTALVHVPHPVPTPGNLRFRRAIARMEASIARLLAERRRSATDRRDLLAVLLQARDEDDGSFMTDQQVRDELVTLFLAGHETTAVALAWTTYLLTRHPQVYASLCAEVDRVLAGRRPSVADLPQLAYTLQVLKEALRLYPPAYVIGRRAIRPVDLNGYHLPADSVVLISPYTLHRRPDYFPDPERFDPERFRPEAERVLPRHAYLPFGGGPRICIGNQFALMEGQLILATLAQHVTFEVLPGQRIEPEPLITLRPRGGIRAIVRRR